MEPKAAAAAAEDALQSTTSFVKVADTPDLPSRQKSAQPLWLVEGSSRTQPALPPRDSAPPAPPSHNEPSAPAPDRQAEKHPDNDELELQVDGIMLESIPPPPPPRLDEHEEDRLRMHSVANEEKHTQPQSFRGCCGSSTKGDRQRRRTRTQKGGARRGGFSCACPCASAAG